MQSASPFKRTFSKKSTSLATPKELHANHRSQKFHKMKTRIPTLALGFLLGVASILMIGQGRPPQAPAPGRYTMVSFSGGICVQDTATGVIKIMPESALNLALNASTPEQFKKYVVFPGAPFE